MEGQPAGWCQRLTWVNRVLTQWDAGSVAKHEELKINEQNIMGISVGQH